MGEAGEQLVTKIKPVQGTIKVVERDEQGPQKKAAKKVTKKKGQKAKSSGKKEIEKTGIMAESTLVAQEDQSTYDLKLYYERTGDETALYVYVEGLIDRLAKGEEKSLALRQEEVEEVLEAIARCPGEGVLLKAELGKHVWEMMNKLRETKYDTTGKQNTASAAWDALRTETLLERGAIKAGLLAKQKIRKDAKKAAKDHSELADIYYYGIEHGKEPQKFHWTDAVELEKQQKAVVANQADRDVVLHKLAMNARNPTEAFVRLKAKVWKDPQTRLRAWENMEGKLMEGFAVSPQEYWRGQLLAAVEDRLKKMRSGAKARLKGKGAKAKFVIGAPKKWKDRENWRGFSPKLAVAEVAGNTVIGQFLESMGRGRYWMGKAMLDYGYWRLARGYLVEHKDEGERSAQGDVLSHIDERLLGDDVREHTGAGAMDLIARDKRTMDILNELFLLPTTLKGDPSTHFESILKDLGNKHGFDHKKDLPDFVTDAVMIATGFWNFDVDNIPATDKRHQIFHFAEFYMKKYVTDALGERVTALLGEGFRLVETEVAKIGFSVGRNRGYDYHAFADDLRPWDPEQFPDQLDKNWQYVYFYMLQRREKGLRRKREPGDQANFPATPGTTAQFMPFDNERVKGGEHDHRKEVYERIKHVLGEHDKLMLENGEGKAGYNKDDLRDRVIKALDEFGGAGVFRIGGVNYAKGENEIFWNEAVEDMMERYRVGGAAALNPTEAAQIDVFVNLQSVLQDARAWGLIYAFDDPEVRGLAEYGKDIVCGMSYMIKANKDKAAMLKLLNAAPYQTPEEMKLNPAAVLDTLLNMSGRFNTEMTFRNSYLLYLYAENVVINRMLQLEIPSVQNLTQMMESTGEVQLGWWKLGWFSSGWWGRELALAKAGYMEKMLQVRLEMIQTGLFDRFDDFMDMWRKTLVATEAFDWSHTRSIPFEQRAYIFKYLAGHHNPFQPVESWRVVDVVKQADGSLQQTGKPAEAGDWIRDGLRVQDLTRKEIGAFFDEIDLQQAGKLFGGQTTVGAIPKDLRAGETMFEGGRFIWNAGAGEWKWDEGEWAFDQDAERMRFYKLGEEIGKKDDGTPILAEKEGFSREKVDLADDSKAENLVDDAKKKKKKRTVEVIYPFLAFKSEQARQEFYKHRMNIIFELTTGRPIDHTPGGDAVIQLDKYYETKKGATMFQLIRQVEALKSESVYQVNRIRTARAVEGGILQYKFKFGGRLEKAINSLVASEKGKAEGNLRKHDVERLRKWISKYDKSWKKALGGWGTRAGLWFAEWGIELGNFKLTPSVIMATVGILTVGSVFAVSNFFGAIPYIFSPAFRAAYATGTEWPIFKALGKGLADIYSTMPGGFLNFGLLMKYVVSYALANSVVDSWLGPWVARRMPQDTDVDRNYPMLTGRDPNGWDDFFPVL